MGRELPLAKGVLSTPLESLGSGTAQPAVPQSTTSRWTRRTSVRRWTSEALFRPRPRTLDALESLLACPFAEVAALCPGAEEDEDARQSPRNTNQTSEKLVYRRQSSVAFF